METLKFGDQVADPHGPSTIPPSGVPFGNFIPCGMGIDDDYIIRKKPPDLIANSTGRLFLASRGPGAFSAEPFNVDQQVLTPAYDPKYTAIETLLRIGFRGPEFIPVIYSTYMDAFNPPHDSPSEVCRRIGISYVAVPGPDSLAHIRFGNCKKWRLLQGIVVSNNDGTYHLGDVSVIASGDIDDGGRYWDQERHLLDVSKKGGCIGCPDQIPFADNYKKVDVFQEGGETGEDFDPVTPVALFAGIPWNGSLANQVTPDIDYTDGSTNPCLP